MVSHHSGRAWILVSLGDGGGEMVGGLTNIQGALASGGTETLCILWYCRNCVIAWQFSFLLPQFDFTSVSIVLNKRPLNIVWNIHPMNLFQVSVTILLYKTLRNLSCRNQSQVIQFSLFKFIQFTFRVLLRIILCWVFHFPNFNI